MSGDDSSPRRYVLSEANYGQLLEYRPNVALLPWGATEAHNYHLPHGTDNFEAEAVAEEAAQLAHARGARPILLPTIPFGNNAQQQDQVATIHLSTASAAALLEDVAASLVRQGIDRLAIFNGHGGNDLRGLIRDAQLTQRLLVVVVNFYELDPGAWEVFDAPGDHADEMETSLMLHLRPELVEMDRAGRGERAPFKLKALSQPGVWTPRPWSHSHPDTGSGDPAAASAAKGAKFFERVAAAAAEVVVELSNAKRGESPYL